MEICNVPPLFWALLFLSFFISLFLSPSIFSSALRLSDHRHPHHGHASDEEALLAFLSAITYDPSQNITATWKRNVSFCEWTGVICSRRRQSGFTRCFIHGIARCMYTNTASLSACTPTNRASQIPGTGDESNHSKSMATAAGNTSSVPQSDGNAPIGHGIMKIAGDELLKFQEGLPIIVK